MFQVKFVGGNVANKVGVDFKGQYNTRIQKAGAVARWVLTFEEEEEGLLLVGPLVVMEMLELCVELQVECH